MFMRDEETLLLLKSESMSMDSPRDEYTPLQYENSLGKLQAVTVKAPRKIIDMSSNVLNQDAEQLSTAQKVNIILFIRWKCSKMSKQFLTSLKIFKQYKLKPSFSIKG